ncbi:unnamed protein product [Echinostoma caproni]|uniref:CDT1 domain-containing protein n=1 Tax=Echinostoma caproni TaxID=27848 RepID=A0A183AIH5_9TREM|nr:unnamed protein product [Echinostoma caproni]
MQSRGVRKQIDLSKQSTINWSPLACEPTVTKTKPENLIERKEDVVSESQPVPTVKVPDEFIAPLAFYEKPIPAFRRFAHLAESPTPVVPDEHTESVPFKPTTPVRPEIELTQTTEKIPQGLVLPFEFRALLELFRSCDTIVSMLHNRKELCSFDKLKPAVQEVVRRNFEESHVAQFMTVYPMVYHLRYEKQLDKYTHRQTGAYVLVLSPNLRTALCSSSQLCILRTDDLFSFQEFLKTLPGINASDLPDDTELRRWHPKFALDIIVPPIQPSPLPIKPSDAEHNITTARDAVRAFQARALFREAEACQNVANSYLSNRLPSIPSPTKASACSPRKLTSTLDGVPTINQAVPSVALFSSSITDFGASADSPISSKLKGISATLLAKVRARENERRLLTQLTRSHIPESRRAIYARLPSFVPQVWTVMRTGNGRPLPLSVVVSRIAGGYHGGLSADAVGEHLNVLLELCPFWIEKLGWSDPHLKVRSAKYSVKEILDHVKETLSKEGYQL